MDSPGQEALQKRLERAEQALERSEGFAVASRFASVIMHEVNNPLESITNLVYLTKLQRDDPDQVLENMHVIEQQLETLGRITRQALTFHRGHTEAKLFDLAEIAKSALKLHGDKILRHGVKVHFRLSGPAPAMVVGSEILQVVSNLILNALEALPLVDGEIHIRVKACTNSVHFMISDNGSGIDSHIAARLFEPYITSKPTGTGLGLWLSRRIVFKYGGTLCFRSSRHETKHGTSFRISLPKANAGLVN